MARLIHKATEVAIAIIGHVGVHANSQFNRLMRLLDNRPRTVLERGGEIGHRTTTLGILIKHLLAVLNTHEYLS